MLGILLALVFACCCASGAVRADDNDLTKTDVFKILGGVSKDPHADLTAPADIQVIGAGFGRTGTTSTRAALNMLGLGPTHHMKAVFQNDDFDAWTDILRAVDDNTPAGVQLRRARLAEVLRGYRATLDFPAVLVYRDLMEMFPDAKVLLTSRDAEAWARSFLDTIGVHLMCNSLDSPQLLHRWDCLGGALFMTLTPLGRRFGRVVAHLTTLFDPSNMTVAAVADTLRRWEAEVEATVKPDRLLKFDVQQGWGPLTEFLGVPAPDGGQEPFPRVNDRTMFTFLTGVLAVIGYTIPVVGLTLVWFVVRCLRRYAGRQGAGANERVKVD